MVSSSSRRLVRVSVDAILRASAAKALNVKTDGLPARYHPLQELIAMEVFQTRQIDAGATFIDLCDAGRRDLFQQQREVYRRARRRRSCYLRL